MLQAGSRVPRGRLESQATRGGECRGFVSRAVVQLLCGSGMTGSNLRKAVKDLEKEAEKLVLE